jgi:L-amino acid N-acyltransferase YncA
MYARPVEMKDAQAIANIYNYYVVNSIIPEDQEPVTVADVENIINYCNYKKLPFIVGVKGTVPSGKDVQGRPGKNAKIIMPQHDNVIGFACIEYSQVGFSGSNHGLHRFTADVKVYVDHKSTRKGVGSNLMDHLIHILHFAYAFKNGCEFVNPNNDPVYKTGGSGMWHILNFRLPSQKKNDLDLMWISGWLKSKFAFYETARLKSWVRSSKAQGPCKFLDVVILQAEALQAEEIECDF